MGSEQRRRKKSGKIWTGCLAVLLFLAVLFHGTETIRDEENWHIYEVYCMGDSITYGSGLGDEERLTASYPARLGQLLGAGYEVVNYGVKGRTLLDTTEKAYRGTGYIDMVRIQSPDILIIMLGTNDSKQRNWNAKAYKQQYLALVAELQEIPSRPAIYLMAPPEAYAGEDGEIIYGIDNTVIRDEIRQIVKEVAEETGEEFIDLYAVTEDHPEYFTDGVHLNREGYEVLARTVYERIREG